MLVVDLHALQTVDVLNFLNQIGCELLNTQNREDVMRHWATIKKQVTLTTMSPSLTASGRPLATDIRLAHHHPPWE